MGFLNKLVIKDLKTGKPSYTLTAFMAGFFVINIKLIFSGVQFTETFRFDTFSGVDYAAAVAALGAIRIGNKKIWLDSEATKKNE